MTTEFFILARAVHLGACMLFFGMLAFDRIVAAAIFGKDKMEAAGDWQRRIRLSSLILLPCILVSGIAWLIFVAMNISGEPLKPDILEIVWRQTQFGAVWKTRFFVWLAAAVVSVFFLFSKPQSPFQKSLVWLQLFLSGILLGGVAWAGHGRESSHWHLFADCVHLLVAGFWPAGLAPFTMLLRQLRRTSEAAVIPLVRRFSALSLFSVSLLAATGLVNSWFLVSPVSHLFDRDYGRWLLVKIALFCIAVAIGAMNLFRLKPRLSGEGTRSQDAETTVAQLQFNVRVEIFLGMAIVVIVAVLGILPPANN